LLRRIESPHQFVDGFTAAIDHERLFRATLDRFKIIAG